MHGQGIARGAPQAIPLPGTSRTTTTSEPELSMSANPQEPPPPGARTGYVTTVVRSLASTVGGPARWRDMAVGAALEGGDVARLMLGSLRWGVAQPRIRINRQVVTTQARVERRLDQLAERGAAGQLSERRRAAEIL